MATVAIIGSNSFTGSHFVDAVLAQTNYDVIGISRSPEYPKIFLPYAYEKSVPERFKFYQFDINQHLEKIMSILDSAKAEVVINLAAQGEVGNSWKYPEQWFQTNCVGNVRFANQLKDRKYLERYIHVSTPEVYGACKGKVKENFNYNPSTPYAASKAAADLFMFALAKNFDFPLVMTRSTNVYGMHQQLYRIIPRTIIYLKLGKQIQLHGGGVAKKTFMHVRDVADAVLKMINAKNPSNLYHLSPNDKSRSVSFVVQYICKKMGHDFEKSTASVGERLGQDPVYEIDSSRARKELKWKPKVKFEKGIDEVIEWIEANWEEIKNQPLEYVYKP